MTNKETPNLDSKENLKELFKSQDWNSLIDGLKIAYEQENYRVGAKQWQEFYDIAFNAGRTEVVNEILEMIPDDPGTKSFKEFLAYLRSLEGLKKEIRNKFIKE